MIVGNPNLAEMLVSFLVLKHLIVYFEFSQLP